VNPWIGKTTFLFGLAVLIAIRAPRNRRSGKIPVIEKRSTAFDTTLLLLTATVTGILLPFLFLLSSFLHFADYPLLGLPFSAGILCLGFGLWLFYRSHADLGTNWSMNLELRERHQLIVSGIYKTIRHPMYSAMFLFALAQALLLANWIAGPGFLVAFGLMFALRVRAEEWMMLEKFGQSYEEYRIRTKRLIPRLW